VTRTEISATGRERDRLLICRPVATIVANVADPATSVSDEWWISATLDVALRPTLVNVDHLAMVLPTTDESEIWAIGRGRVPCPHSHSQRRQQCQEEARDAVRVVQTMVVGRMLSVITAIAQIDVHHRQLGAKVARSRKVLGRAHLAASSPTALNAYPAPPTLTLSGETRCALTLLQGHLNSLERVARLLLPQLVGHQLCLRPAQS
jgi:hypothetical protein